MLIYDFVTMKFVLTSGTTQRGVPLLTNPFQNKTEQKTRCVYKNKTWLGMNTAHCIWKPLHIALGINCNRWLVEICL